jgi:simple sugar transport system permease protein
MRTRRIAIAVLAAALSIALLSVTGIAFGHSPAELLSILISGSVGSSFALQGTLLKSIPLLLTGLSVAIAFRAGVWNIGGEGQFLAGALGAFLAARYSHRCWPAQSGPQSPRPCGSGATRRKC